MSRGEELRQAMRAVGTASAIVAARWSEVEEGHLLHLWVQLPPDAVEESDDEMDDPTA